MLERLDIQNFQSWEEVHFDFHPGINVLVGPTDNGKTAVLRALWWFIKNKPGGTKYISDWCYTKSGAIRKGEACKVSLSLNGKEASRYRDSKHNGYVVEEKDLEAIGSDVPPEVNEYLNIGDVNIQRQLDSPFLVSATSGEVSRFFNKLVDLEAIDRSLSIVDSKKRETTADLKRCISSREELETQLLGFNWVDQAEKELEALTDLEEKRAKTYSKIETLTTLREEIEKYDRKIEQSRGVARIESFLDEYVLLVASTESKRESLTKLDRLATSLVSCESAMQKTEVAVELEELLEQVSSEQRRLLEVQNKYTALAHIGSRLEAVQDRLVVLDKVDVGEAEKLLGEIETLSKEKKDKENLADILRKTNNRVIKQTTLIEICDEDIAKLEEEMPDVCPLCGNSMENCNEEI